MVADFEPMLIEQCMLKGGRMDQSTQGVEPKEQWCRLHIISINQVVAHQTSHAQLVCGLVQRKTKYKYDLAIWRN